MKNLGPWRCLGFVLLAFFGLVVAATPVWSQPGRTLEQRGSCLTVELPGLLKMPDGSSRRATTMRICLERWVAPNAALHEVYIDGRPWGLVMSHAGKSKTITDERTIVVFERNALGDAVLIGYSRPDYHGMITHVFHRVGSKPDPRFQDPATLLEACKIDDHYVVVAAGRRR